jgi:hypothetical protein
MQTIVTRINEQLTSKSVDPETAFGRAWLLQKIRSLNPGAKDRMEIIRQREQQRNRTIIGRFYFFAYAAKWHETLPYWDRFPMVIPLQRYNDGFLGLNLHYIYPKDRLILLTQLKRFASGPLTDEGTRLRLTYPLLKALHQAYRATPCIKRYLAGHVRSRFIEIPTIEWEVAATVPVQSFTSEARRITKEEVWKDSKENY